eukprot:SAG11_NODE_13969_length_631_cov_0.761278_1_plen_175_part_10
MPARESETHRPSAPRKVFGAAEWRGWRAEIAQSHRCVGRYLSSMYLCLRKPPLQAALLHQVRRPCRKSWGLSPSVRRTQGDGANKRDTPCTVSRRRGAERVSVSCVGLEEVSRSSVVQGGQHFLQSSCNPSLKATFATRAARTYDVYVDLRRRTSYVVPGRTRPAGLKDHGNLGS